MTSRIAAIAAKASSLVLLAATSHLATTACKAPGADEAGSSSNVLVNFTPEGNRQLKLMYDGLGNDCGAPTGKRILISYFGPWVGSTSGNASERLALLAMAQRVSTNGTGSGINANGTATESAIANTQPPVEDDEDEVIEPTGYSLAGEFASPAVSQAGTIVVDGTTYPVCWVKGEVNLRFPAALHKIAKDFRPEVVISMGEAPYTRFETSALNRLRTTSVFYDAAGNPITDPNQRNTSTNVIENGDATADTPVVVQQVDFTWDAAALQQRTGATAGGVDENNIYVCNATATVIGYAIKAQNPFTYAPGLDLSPLPSTIKHGFLHVDRAGKVEDALEILEEIVRTSVAPPG